MNLIRRIRRSWRRIEYYSARKQQTVWTRASDVAFVLSLLLALPCTILTQSIIVRDVEQIAVQGAIESLVDTGEIIARLTEEDRNVSASLTGRSVGTFFVRATDECAGWPFAMRIRPQAATLDLDLFASPQRQIDVTLPEDDPMHEAIAAEVLVRSDSELALRWHARTSPERLRTQRVLRSWVANTFIWWVMLVFATAVVVRIARVIVLVFESSRAAIWSKRLKRGACVECGYDLRGLEFNERCPECGSLLE
ncbi:MAG: hypothetical protein AAF432_07055 [Planctomycetota bacterium]